MPTYTLEECLLSLPVPHSSTNQYFFGTRDFLSPTTDSLWQVESGVVRTWTRTPNNQRVALGYWGPGEILGSPLSRLNPYFMQCVTNVKVSMLSPMLLERSLDVLVSQFQQTEHLLSILHSQPVSLRLWQFLVWLSHKFGRDVDQGRLIDLTLTHQEMAEAISATRVSVTRILQQLEKQGNLQRHSKQLIITSSAASSTYLPSD